MGETCAALEGEVSSASEQQRAMAASAGTQGGLTVASGLQDKEQASTQLRRFLDAEIQPFLQRPAHAHRLAQSNHRRRPCFSSLRVLFPAELHSNIDDLENICEEKRQLDKQSRLHKILHGWLLVHIPLSYAVLLSGRWHAVVALRF